MAAENVAFLFASRPRSRDWTSQELAEFYRVESALIQGGMKITTDRGLSDEGDPWFVFCREEGGEPVVHFARIDGQYIIASPAYQGVARGLDFRSMVQDLISRHKLAPVNKEQKSNIFMHPAALLVIVVGTAFFKSPGEAKADETQKPPARKSDGSSGVFHDRSGSQATSANGDSASETVGDKLELARNMSQLLMVAASAILAADADQMASPALAADSSIHPSDWTDGASSQHGVATHHFAADQTNAAIFETISDEVSAFSTMTPPNPTPVSFGAIASSALKLMTDLNDIPSVHSDNSIDHTLSLTRDNGLSSIANGFGGESGFLAQKLAVLTPSATEAAVAQVAGVMHPSASSGGLSASQGTGFYESGTIVQQLPDSLLNVLALANVATQTGNADSFLAGNNIYIDLHQATALAENVAALPDSIKQTIVNALDLTNHDSQVPTAPVTTNTQVVTNTQTTTALQDGSAGASTVSGSAVVASQYVTETLTSAVFIKTLDLFMEDTPALGVYYSNDHYLFYNAADVTTKAPQLESVSMTFSDGSSISIVGQVQFLNNIIAHAQ